MSRSATARAISQLEDRSAQHGHCSYRRREGLRGVHTNVRATPIAPRTEFLRIVDFELKLDKVTGACA
jgi:hypothetical protein